MPFFIPLKDLRGFPCSLVRSPTDRQVFHGTSRPKGRFSRKLLAERPGTPAPARTSGRASVEWQDNLADPENRGIIMGGTVSAGRYRVNRCEPFLVAKVNSFGLPLMNRKNLTLALLMIVSWCVGPTETLCAQDASGVWRGRWTAFATPQRREHGGPVRVRLTKVGPSTYRGTFSGRFAIVIPYVYRATVYQSGGTLYADKQLGRFGQYRMALQPWGNTLSGNWSAGNSRGAIQLRRR